MASNKVYDSIIHACEAKKIDWTRVRELVASLGTKINEPYEEGTILSELYMNLYAYQRGEILLELTRVFFSCGYDVYANNGMNGGECLRSLCWASYGAYILKVAELLLDAGADPNYINSDEDEEDSVLDSIDGKLCYWGTGEYLSANLFEAYSRMIQVAQRGEDYHGIRAGETGVGKQINKIEKLSFADRDEHKRGTVQFVVRCDSVPLIITETAEIYIDPTVDRLDAEREDVSEQYPNLIGSRIKDFLYADPCIALIALDNRRSLAVLSSGSESEPYVRLVVSGSLRKAILKPETHIKGVYFSSGICYSDRCRSYRENAVLIQTDSGNLLLHSAGEDYKAHKLSVLNIGHNHPEHMSRKLVAETIQFIESFRTGASLRGLHFLCDGRHLYLSVTKFREIKLYLSDTPVDPKSIDHYSECEKIEFEYGKR